MPAGLGAFLLYAPGLTTPPPGGGTGGLGSWLLFLNNQPAVARVFTRPHYVMVVARPLRIDLPVALKRIDLTTRALRVARSGGRLLRVDLLSAVKRLDLTTACLRVASANALMIIYDPKHPGDTDSYGVDWTPLLGAGETIVTSVWSYTGPDAALLVGAGAYAPAIASPQTKVWYSAGTDGAQYRLLNTVTTSSTPPRTLSRAALLPISSSV